MVNEIAQGVTAGVVDDAKQVMDAQGSSPALPKEGQTLTSFGGNDDNSSIDSSMDSSKNDSSKSDSLKNDSSKNGNGSQSESEGRESQLPHLSANYTTSDISRVQALYDSLLLRLHCSPLPPVQIHPYAFSSRNYERLRNSVVRMLMEKENGGVYPETVMCTIKQLLLPHPSETSSPTITTSRNLLKTSLRLLSLISSAAGIDIRSMSDLLAVAQSPALPREIFSAVVDALFVMTNLPPPPPPPPTMNDKNLVASSRGDKKHKGGNKNNVAPQHLQLQPPTPQDRDPTRGPPGDGHTLHTTKSSPLSWFTDCSLISENTFSEGSNSGKIGGGGCLPKEGFTAEFWSRIDDDIVVENEEEGLGLFSLDSRLGGHFKLYLRRRETSPDDTDPKPPVGGALEESSSSPESIDKSCSSSYSLHASLEDSPLSSGPITPPISPTQGFKFDCSVGSSSSRAAPPLPISPQGDIPFVRGATVRRGTWYHFCVSIEPGQQSARNTIFNKKNTSTFWNPNRSKAKNSTATGKSTASDYGGNDDDDGGDDDDDNSSGILCVYVDGVCCLRAGCRYPSGMCGDGDRVDRIIVCGGSDGDGGGWKGEIGRVGFYGGAVGRGEEGVRLLMSLGCLSDDDYHHQFSGFSRQQKQPSSSTSNRSASANSGGGSGKKVIAPTQDTRRDFPPSETTLQDLRIKGVSKYNHNSQTDNEADENNTLHNRHNMRVTSVPSIQASFSSIFLSSIWPLFAWSPGSLNQNDYSDVGVDGDGDTNVENADAKDNSTNIENIFCNGEYNARCTNIDNVWDDGVHRRRRSRPFLKRRLRLFPPTVAIRSGGCSGGLIPSIYPLFVRLAYFQGTEDEAEYDETGRVLRTLFHVVAGFSRPTGGDVVNVRSLYGSAGGGDGDSGKKGGRSGNIADVFGVRLLHGDGKRDEDFFFDVLKHILAESGTGGIKQRGYLGNLDPKGGDATLLVRSLVNLRLATEGRGVPGRGVVEGLMFDFRFWFRRGKGGDDFQKELVKTLGILCRVEGQAVLGQREDLRVIQNIIDFMDQTLVPPAPTATNSGVASKLPSADDSKSTLTTLKTLTGCIVSLLSTWCSLILQKQSHHESTREFDRMVSRGIRPLLAYMTKLSERMTEEVMRIIEPESEDESDDKGELNGDDKANGIKSNGNGDDDPSGDDGHSAAPTSSPLSSDQLILVPETLSLLAHALLHLLSDANALGRKTRVVFLAGLIKACDATNNNSSGNSGDNSNGHSAPGTTNNPNSPDPTTGLSAVLSWTLMTIVNCGGRPITVEGLPSPPSPLLLEKIHRLEIANDVIRSVGIRVIATLSGVVIFGGRCSDCWPTTGDGQAAKDAITAGKTFHEHHERLSVEINKKSAISQTRKKSSGFSSFLSSNLQKIGSVVSQTLNSVQEENQDSNIAHAIYGLGKGIVHGVAEYATGNSASEQMRAQWGPDMPHCVVKSLTSMSSATSSSLNDLFDAVSKAPLSSSSAAASTANSANNSTVTTNLAGLELFAPTSYVMHHRELSTAVKLLWHILKVRAGSGKNGLGKYTMRAYLDLIIFNNYSFAGSSEANDDNRGYASDCQTRMGSGAGGRWMFSQDGTYQFDPPLLEVFATPPSQLASLPSPKTLVIDSTSFNFRPIPSLPGMAFRLLRFLTDDRKVDLLVQLLTLTRVGGFRYFYGEEAERRVHHMVVRQHFSKNGGGGNYGSSVKSNNPQQRSIRTSQLPSFVVSEWQSSLFTCLSDFVEECDGGAGDKRKSAGGERQSESKDKSDRKSKDNAPQNSLLPSILTKVFVTLMLSELGLSTDAMIGVGGGEDDNSEAEGGHDDDDDDGAYDNDDKEYNDRAYLESILSSAVDEGARGGKSQQLREQTESEVGRQFKGVRSCSAPLSDVSIEPFIVLASLSRTVHNGEKVFRMLLSAILEGISTTVNSWQKIHSGGGRIGRKSRRKYKQKRIRTWAIVSSFVSRLWMPIVCKDKLGVVDQLDYVGVRDKVSEGAGEELEGVGGLKLDGMTIVSTSTSEISANIIITNQLLSILDFFIFPDDLKSSGDVRAEQTQSHGLNLVNATKGLIVHANTDASGNINSNESISTISNDSGEGDSVTSSSPQKPTLVPFLHIVTFLTVTPLTYLPPSSITFLHACGRLRCLVGWALKERRDEGGGGGVGMLVKGGGNIPFQEGHNASSDRLLLCGVLHSHNGLERCARLLSVYENEGGVAAAAASAPDAAATDSQKDPATNRKKSARRILRSSHELKELVSSVHRMNGEAIRVGLHPKAWSELGAALKDGNLIELEDSSASNANEKRELILRKFLNSEWVRRWHEVEKKEGPEGELIPSMVSNGQMVIITSVSEGVEGKKSTKVTGVLGRKAIFALSVVCKGAENSGETILSSGFFGFLQSERKWSYDMSTRVRGLEELGGKIMDGKILQSEGEELRELERQKEVTGRCSAIVKDLGSIMASSGVSISDNSAKVEQKHYKITPKIDRKYRHGLLLQPMGPGEFDDHAKASYGVTLEREREKDNQRREQIRQKEVLIKAMQTGKVESMEEDNENENENEIENGDSVSGKTEMGHHKELEKTETEGESEEEEAEGWENIERTDVDAEEDDGWLWARKLLFKRMGDIEEKMVVGCRVVVLRITGNLVGSLVMLSSYHLFIKEGSSGSSNGKILKFPLSKVTEILPRNYLLKSQGLEFFFSDRESLSIAFTPENGSSYNMSKLDSGVKARELFWNALRRRYYPNLAGNKRYVGAEGGGGGGSSTGKKAGRREQLRKAVGIGGGEVCGGSVEEYNSHILGSLRLGLQFQLGKFQSARTLFNRSKLTEAWRHRKISNYEYLMRVNMLAGRSFNDITQYPVFPWVLSNYGDSRINLEDESNYRDLSKPVGALNEERLRSLLERYEDLDGFDEEFKFLYGSHYSSPGVVLHYLIRQEPFTSLAIDLQGGRFDCPDRLFFSIKSCWEGCMNSSSDVKELIPEFFSSPQIFKNNNNFPLGELQDGRGAVGDVELPKWANSDPHEFVRINRKALESDIVSRMLPKWIDLVFGFKQRGEAAIRANNLFHYLSYENAVDIDIIVDPVERAAAEGHIMNFGTTPIQLMGAKEGAHPFRYPINECWLPLFSSVKRLKELKAYTPEAQFGGGGERGKVLSVASSGTHMIALYADLSVGIYNWSAQDKDGCPFSVKMLTSGKIGVDNSSNANGVCGLITKCSSGSVKLGGENILELDVGLENIRILTSGYDNGSVFKLHNVEGLRELVSQSSGGLGRSGKTRSCHEACGLVCTGGEDGVVRIFEFDEVELRGIGCLYVHNCEVTCVRVAKDIGCVVSCDVDNVLVVSEIGSSCKEIRRFDCGIEGRFLCFGERTGNIIVADERNVVVFGIDGIRLCSCKVEGRITAMAGGNLGKFVVIGTGEGMVEIRSAHNLKLVRNVDLRSEGGVTSITFSPEDFSVLQYCFIGSSSGKISIISDPKHRLKMMQSAINESIPWFS